MHITVTGAARTFRLRFPVVPIHDVIQGLLQKKRCADVRVSFGARDTLSRVEPHLKQSRSALHVCLVGFCCLGRKGEHKHNRYFVLVHSNYRTLNSSSWSFPSRESVKNQQEQVSLWVSTSRTRACESGCVSLADLLSCFSNAFSTMSFTFRSLDINMHMIRLRQLWSIQTIEWYRGIVHIPPSSSASFLLGRRFRVQC